MNFCILFMLKLKNVTPDHCDKWDGNAFWKKVNLFQGIFS